MIKLNGGYTYVTCYKIDFDEISKLDIASCKEPKETLSSYYNRQYEKPDLLCNGGFFGLQTGLPCFNLIDENISKAYDSNLKYGIGITTDGNIKYGSVDEGNYRDFISGYPVLVADGRKVPVTYGKEVDGYHPRTLLGINDSFVFICTVDGRKRNKPGMTFSQAAELMIAFGCNYAINLDGGGSTRMLYNGKVVNSPTENRSVDNVIAVYLKTTTNQPPVITPTPDSGSDRVYTVKYGDSLWQIAQENMGNGMRYTTLAAHNGIKTNSVITPGQNLKIPAQYDIKKNEIPITNNNTSPVTPTKPPYTTYMVKNGDCMWTIAQKYLGDGSKYPIIMEYNNMTTPAIYTNQIIKIPN